LGTPGARAAFSWTWLKKLLLDTGPAQSKVNIALCLNTAILDLWNQDHGPQSIRLFALKIRSQFQATDGHFVARSMISVGH
jgi:hypothetical protein